MYSDNQTKLIARWIIFTFIGGMLGSQLGSFAGNQYGYLLGHNIENTLSNIFPSGYLPSMVAGLIYGGVIGVFIGFFQWVTTLRHYYKDSDEWIFIHIIGYASAICLNSGVYAYLIYHLGSSWSVYMIYACVSGLETGLIVGFLEWRFFSPRHRRAIWWLILATLDGVLLGWIGTLDIFIVPGRKFWIELVFAIIMYLGIATFTSIAFYITLPSTVPELTQTQ